ncbi:MAG TPA: TonB family protein [Ohtaekwangia sp.]|uniref:TonB family protein n=1 Tax=Ohtaekwangia sp. TaxID=2066019 RepID=UPI002F95FB34
MNIYLNYLLEANIALAFFLALYSVLLRNETDFRLKRGYLLFAIVASVVLPLFHFHTTEQVMPSLGDIMPPNWLPEVTIVANGTTTAPDTTPVYDVWYYLNIVYIAGVLLFLIVFLWRLSQLLMMVYKATAYQYEKFLIIESNENRSAFSFFRFIFIGQVDQLSGHEKQQIIEHESVHARQLHSIDILLVNLLSIFFWFNPVVILYKKIFVQLHEFEADARAVANQDVNEYCSLLAKVALLSADFKLANHFSNSLTVKRIEMMRTIKSKIKGWKIAAILCVLPAVFFVVSCQDQVMNEAQDIASNSTMALDYPKEVQTRLDELAKASPDKKFIVIEPDANSADKAEDLKRKTEGLDPSYISSMDVIKNVADKDGNIRSFIIIEYNEAAHLVALKTTRDGGIFTVVEESATYNGGFDAMGSFIADNLKYPEEARKKGLEGKVFIQFVVNTDGSLSDFVVKRGVDASLDAAAIDVVKAMPNWNPGKQSGNAVRQQFVLPIVFSLGDGKNDQSSLQPVAVEKEFAIVSSVTQKQGTKIVAGIVKDKEGKPLAGSNILIVGQTKGTTTDANGNFSIEVGTGSGSLAVSYIGYKSETIAF